MFSDSYKFQEVDGGIFYEVEGKVRKNQQIYESLCNTVHTSKLYLTDTLVSGRQLYLRPP